MSNVFQKAPYSLFLMIMLLFSCNENKKQNLLTDNLLSTNLIISNDRIYQQTNAMIEKFRQYSSNPSVSTITNPMLENMELAKKVTAGTIDYLDDLKRELKIAAGLKLVDLKETYNEDDLTAVSNIFITKEKGNELFNHLIQYQNSIQQINPDLYISLKSPYYFFDYFSIPKETMEKEFTHRYFDKLNAVSAIAVLTKFENDVRLYENRAISFFFNKVAIDVPVKA